jgi:hypothetical protein
MTTVTIVGSLAFILFTVIFTTATASLCMEPNDSNREKDNNNE